MADNCIEDAEGAFSAGFEAGSRDEPDSEEFQEPPEDFSVRDKFEWRIGYAQGFQSRLPADFDWDDVNHQFGTYENGYNTAFCPDEALLQRWWG